MVLYSTAWSMSKLKGTASSDGMWHKRISSLSGSHMGDELPKGSGEDDGELS